jgi:hypothetical protein
MVFGVDIKPKMVIGIDIFTDDSTVKTRTVSGGMYLVSATPTKLIIEFL